MSSIHVHTLGDSTLDNLYWELDKHSLEEAKQTCVEGQLRAKLGKDTPVFSHAYDGFTTRSVLEADYIGRVLPDWPSKSTYMEEKLPASEHSRVYPLNQLKGHVEKHKDQKHVVVLSVGGNDFRENLRNPLKLLRDIPHVQERYLKIAQRLKEMNVEPILMLQYRTDANDDPYLIYPLMTGLGVLALTINLFCMSLLTAPLWALAAKVTATKATIAFSVGALGLYGSQKIVPLSFTKNALRGRNIGISFLGSLMEVFYRPILEQALKDQLPVLDLPNTFNPKRPLYTCGIEPSEEGAKLIAEGISHIIAKREPEAKSTLYSKPDGADSYISSDNVPEDWKVEYPQKV